MTVLATDLGNIVVYPVSPKLARKTRKTMIIKSYSTPTETPIYKKAQRVFVGATTGAYGQNGETIVFSSKQGRSIPVNKAAASVQTAFAGFAKAPKAQLASEKTRVSRHAAALKRLAEL